MQQYYPYNNRQAVTGLKGYPVSSLEEVRAAVVDFDGSIFFFPDLINKRIYTKQINLDGTASLNMYAIAELPVEKTPAETGYITKEEFDKAIQELKSALTALTPPKIDF